MWGSQHLANEKPVQQPQGLPHTQEAPSFHIHKVWAEHSASPEDPRSTGSYDSYDSQNEGQAAETRSLGLSGLPPQQGDQVKRPTT